MTHIPWTQLGVGGAFAIIVLCIVFKFVSSMKNGKKIPCVNHPKVVESFQRNVLTSEAVGEIRKEMQEQTKHLIQHTILLKILARKANGGIIDL